MKTYITYILSSILAITILSCGDSEYPRSVSGGGIGVPNVGSSMSGAINGQFIFVILAESNLANPSVGRSGMSTSLVNSDTPSWSGSCMRESGKWSYKVSDDVALIGGVSYPLKDGEVFVLSDDFQVTQLKGSKAGDKGDKANLEKLGKMYQNYISEQDVALQSATRSEPKLEADNKTQTDSEDRSQ